MRILRPNGRFLIFVWAFEQQPDSKRIFDTQDTLVPWSMPRKYQHSEHRSSIDTEEDGAVEASKNQIYQRYYHVFVKGELEDLLMNTIQMIQISDPLASKMTVHIEQSGYERDNWYILGSIKVLDE